MNIETRRAELAEFLRFNVTSCGPRISAFPPARVDARRVFDAKR
jgi:hypothetical protein